MSQRGWVSVIVPIYNVEKYLEECLTSIATQSYADLEVILVNDGSTDRSPMIAQQYVEKDKRFHLYHQSNQGQSAARNRGIKEATGEYISFIDADDYIAPDFYECMLSALQHNDAAQCGYTRIDEIGKVEQVVFPKHNYQFTSASMRLYRTSFVHEHELRFEEGKIYEDVIFSVDVWLCRPALTTLSYAGYFYRQNPHSTTSVQHDTRPLFEALHQRIKKASLSQKMLILYTALRLRVHFLLGR